MSSVQRPKPSRRAPRGNGASRPDRLVNGIAPGAEPGATDAQKLSSLLHTMPARVAYLDRRRRYRFVNHAYASAVGLLPEQIIGLSAAQVMGKARARHMAPLVRAALAGQTTRRQAWSKYPLAGWDYVDTLYSPVRGADGRVDGYIVLVRDLTELKRREEELAARTAQLEAILAGIADGVTIADAEERLVMCNEGFVDMFAMPAALVRPGVPREAFVRHRIAQGIYYPGEAPGESAERLVAERTARVRAAGGVLREDIEVRGRSLHVRRYELPDGTSVSTFSDFTARIEAEQAQQRQREALREAQQLGTVTALLAGVAHELNNPLSVVAARASMLAEEAAETPFAEQAEAVHAAARHCGRIVSSLLSRLRSRAPKRERVRIQDMLAAALDLIGTRLRTTAIQVATEMPAELPPLLADPDQIVHLLANLLGNAMAALQDRSDAPRILVAAAAARGTLTVRVIDNGPGIPAGLRDRIFRPFFTTKADGAGTGVGLTLCHIIVQDHFGRITVEDTPGGGATFVVSLPLAAHTLERVVTE